MSTHRTSHQQPLATIAAALSIAALPVNAFADASPSTAAAQMSQPGEQERSLQVQAGTWNVVATMWPAQGAQPVVTKGLTAERKSIGNYLEETIRPASGSAAPDFRRIDYLNFDRVEGRWKYVSMDTRFPVSIMPAWGTGLADPNKIELQFMPQAFVGIGPAVEGRFMLSDMTISCTDQNHCVKEQHANMADGTGRSWLFVRYEYSRARF